MSAPAKSAPPTVSQSSVESPNSPDNLSGLLGQLPVVGALAARERQQDMWDEAGRIQKRLSNNLKADAADPKSPTSLGLTLDNEKLQRAQTAYVSALQPAGEREDDIVGYVFAINGRVNSAAVYSSNGLFRKMWPKLLRASAVEAIGAGTDNAKAPEVEEVKTFLKDAEAGQPTERKLTASVTQQTRDAPQSLFVETKRAEGAWIARSYLAK
jgi:hypothetical protein